MISYIPGREHDMLLTSWWARMDADGELETTLAESCRILSGFIASFQRPRVLFFDADENGICMAIWFEPLMSGAFAGLWVAQHKRHSPSTLKNFRAIFDIALRHFSVIIGVTKKENLISQHERLGYELLGRIPSLFDGEDAWILTLTREGFNEHRRGRKRRNVAERSA